MAGAALPVPDVVDGGGCTHNHPNQTEFELLLDLRGGPQHYALSQLQLRPADF
jgi:hypothetical protein